MAAPATAAAWPTVPPLRLLPSPVQLALPDVAAPAAVWERRHVASDGGPVVVVRIARLQDGAGWRVSFGLAHVDDAGAVEEPSYAALDVDTFGAARAAADFGWMFVDGAAAAFVRHVSRAAAAAADDAGDALEPRGDRGRVLRFERPAPLAPTG